MRASMNMRWPSTVAVRDLARSGRSRPYRCPAALARARTISRTVRSGQPQWRRPRFAKSRTVPPEVRRRGLPPGWLTPARPIRAPGRPRRPAHWRHRRRRARRIRCRPASAIAGIVQRRRSAKPDHRPVERDREAAQCRAARRRRAAPARGRRWPRRRARPRRKAVSRMTSAECRVSAVSTRSATASRRRRDRLAAPVARRANSSAPRRAAPASQLALPAKHMGGIGRREARDMHEPARHQPVQRRCLRGRSRGAGRAAAGTAMIRS